jgi:hypothetical protein
VLDFLIQRRRDAQAAKKLMVKLLKKHGFAPSRVVTDRLRSYPAAFRAIGLTAEHDQGLRANNRAENSHQPIRRRERKLQQFKSPGSVQRFFAIHAATFNAFTHQRHLLRRPHFKELRAGSSMLRPRNALPHDACCQLPYSPRLNADNVTKPPVERVGSPQLVGHLGQQFGTGAMTEHCLRRLLFARPRCADLCGATPCGSGCDGKCRFRRSARSLSHGRSGWS